MNRNVVIAVGGIILLGIVGIFILNSDVLNKETVEEENNEMSGEPVADEAQKAVDEETTMEMKELLYTYSGELDDVTQGVEVRGINTGGEATGVAKSNWDGSQYLLLAVFENLPEPAGDDFYEGWVVQREPFMFISTGKLEMVDEVFTNAYRSDQNLTSYDFYVLTIEPNDGDPAPADHILEGTMTE